MNQGGSKTTSIKLKNNPSGHTNTIDHPGRKPSRRRAADTTPAWGAASSPLPSAVGTAPILSHPSPDINGYLLSLLYETVGKPDGWNTFIDALARSYRGGLGVLLVHDLSVLNGFAQASGQASGDQVAAYNAYYASVNPWLPNLDKRPTGLVVPADFLLPRADLLKTEFYSDFLRPAGLDSGIGVTVQKDGSRHMIVSVLFPEATGERDPDSIGRLQLLVPHLLKVAQLNRQLAGIEARAAAAEAAIDRLAVAMLVVNDAARVVYMNPAADAVISAGDGLTVSRAGLDAVSPAEGQALRTLVASALSVSRTIGAAPGGVMRITRRSGRTPYEVLVSPISNTTLGLGFSGPLAAVFARDPDTRTVMPMEWLRRLYSLTAAEARLMQRILAGETLDRIAERHGVAKETLRSQLKAIFLKTDTTSQVELVRLGLRGLAAFQEQVEPGMKLVRRHPNG